MATAAATDDTYILPRNLLSSNRYGHPLHSSVKIVDFNQTDHTTSHLRQEERMALTPRYSGINSGQGRCRDC